MFLKADGTEVWLRSSRRLPYLSLAGVIETSEEYSSIRSKLCRTYELLPGVASDDAFLVLELEASGAALIFCARPDKHCALLLLGKFDLSRERREACTVLEKLVEVVGNCVDEISLRAGVTIQFEVVQPELAMGDFDLQLH
ncbi:hypothetical protein QN224_30010 [Sinorhizobium sp. 8-89]|uniref:hypothetical protein n=1 Tax=Sinorhizobium sp. 7-81 TaxID=3049087 RepID=UPI0024C4712B|nr:hypothetical protein [Sinorhizobium sp. 7-81]MDK1389615.1 hypothetical protein [Sinorhizobium sp. 7-81]